MAITTMTKDYEHDYDYDDDYEHEHDVPGFRMQRATAATRT